MNKNKIKKAVSYILAEGEDFTLENRLLLSSIIIGILINIFSALLNTILATSFIAIIVPLLLAGVVFVLYYIVRYRKAGEILPTITIVFCIIGVAVIWVFNGGINSGNIMPAFVLLILGLIVVPDKFKKYIITLFIGVNIFILLIQFFRPNIIVPFQSETDRWIDTLISLIYSSYFIYLIVIFILKNYNIERYKAEENEKKFRLLYDNSPDMYFSLSPDNGKILRCNETFFNVLGYSKDEIIGQSIFSLDQGTNTDDFRNTFTQFVETGKVTNKELSLAKKDGTKINVSLNSDAIRDANGKILYSISSLRDISEQKRAELIILEQNKELVKLNADKDRFMSILAHDLKTPFTSLLGFSDFLLENFKRFNSDKIEEQLTIINTVSHQTFKLLDDLLLWSKAQSGSLPYKPEKTDFHEMCAQIIEGFSYQANAKKIVISNLVPQKLFLSTDQNMLKTVLRNLISNAIKFTNDNGLITIFAVKNELTALITLSDNGLGISKEHLNKLWDISQTHTTEGTSGEKGTGLGLLLCREFIEKHEGEIWVESKYGKGSDFKFTLPLVKN